ncbi:MAG TPA: VOC family protein [Acidimicrobiales bacterium]|nr:VOC family protein [Acidimicrobiales bacterium]
MHELTPFLMFCGDQHGKAEEAIERYCSIFQHSRVVRLDRYGPGDGEPAGTLRFGVFEIGGYPIRAIDSAAPHRFGFTPAISLWVECSSDEEIERAAAALADGGAMLMPLDSYGFSPKFCWVADRYGVTWQLNLSA